MKITAHTLVKNEERFLFYSVTSVIDFVDKLLLWDMGSSDASPMIEKELAKRYPDKIVLNKNLGNFTQARQEMLEATNTDWFVVVDGDEIWWRDSIKQVVQAVTSNTGNKEVEAIFVPTVNLVGDMFHYQEKEAGRYRFGQKIGHYNLRAVRRDIPGLHSSGEHGAWGWADDENKQIQNRNTTKFVNAPYLHASFLRRSGQDRKVVKRAKKYKYELGKSFAKDFYYPEVFFGPRPRFVPSVWKSVDFRYKCKALLETPIKKMYRRTLMKYAKEGY